MKLRNKKTGEIIIPTDYTFATYDDGIKYGHHIYYSLAELNDEWEDCEPTEQNPKRYRLIKDLPTFKAGEIFEIFDGNLYKINESDGEDTEYEVMVYHASTLKKFPNILEDWFEPIDAEDINVTNIPLVKDEKIRKAVCAWAEANDITKVCYDAHWDAFRCSDFVIAFDYDFDIHDGLKDMKSYTITELCGEEEE